MNTNNDVKNRVVVELVVVDDRDLDLVRQLLPNAEESNELVWIGGPVPDDPLVEPPLLVGHPSHRKLAGVPVDPLAEKDVYRRVLRATFPTVPSAHEACRLVP